MNDGLDYGTERGSTVRARLDADRYRAMRRAIRHNQPIACLVLIESITADRHVNLDAIRLAVTASPGIRSLFRRRRDDWDQVRLTALAALRRYDPASFPPFAAKFVFDPSERVRSAARASLIEMGPDAAEALARAGESPAPWTPANMISYLGIVRDLPRPVAANTLARIVSHEWPRTDSRRERSLIQAPYRGMMGFGAVAIALFSARFISWTLWNETGRFYPFTIDAVVRAGLVVTAVTIGVMALAHLALVPIYVALSPANAIVRQRERRNIEAAAADIIVEMNAVEALQPLLKHPFISFRDRQLKRVFKQLLTGVTAETMPSLDAYQRRQLARLMETNDRGLQLAALLAIEHVGRDESIDPVTSVSRGGLTKEIRATAKQVLITLLERQRQAEQPAVLLRAAYAPPAPADELLRATFAVPETPANELLRSYAEDQSVAIAELDGTEPTIVARTGSGEPREATVQVVMNGRDDCEDR